MNFEPSRRGILRGLATLPLIGGSVTILGQPTRVAFDTSAQLRERYLWWLRLEHTKLCHEIVDGPVPGYGPGAQVGHIPAFALPDAPDMVAIIGAGSASSRAAVMLSAAGVPWTSQYADRHQHRAERTAWPRAPGLGPVCGALAGRGVGRCRHGVIHRALQGVRVMRWPSAASPL